MNAARKAQERKNRSGRPSAAAYRYFCEGCQRPGKAAGLKSGVYRLHRVKAIICPKVSAGQALSLNI